MNCVRIAPRKLCRDETGGESTTEECFELESQQVLVFNCDEHIIHSDDACSSIPPMPRLSKFSRLFMASTCCLRADVLIIFTILKHGRLRRGILAGEKVRSMTGMTTV